jgi:ribonuclease-3
LADALEAVVAAIHLDSDYGTCRAVVLPWFEAQIASLPVGKVDKDPKTRLQEWLQARQKPRPEYRLIESSGEEHALLFRVECCTSDPSCSESAHAGSLRAAEQAAAALVLEKIEAMS